MKSNSSPDECKERGADESSETAIHFVSGSGMGGGSRAGLFRTPISGGVQSATSAHDLPRPALAVRNLMEQVAYCFECKMVEIVGSVKYWKIIHLIEFIHFHHNYHRSLLIEPKS